MDTALSAERVFEREHPTIEWQVPLPITCGTDTRFCCRYCIALYGLKAKDLPTSGFETPEGCVEHIKSTHGRPG